MDKQLLIGKIENLEVRIKHLLIGYKELKEELKNSKEQIKSLKEVIGNQNEELKNFQNQLKISRIVSSMAESTRNSSELKLKINEYIKEIDKCIAHLSE